MKFYLRKTFGKLYLFVQRNILDFFGRISMIEVLVLLDQEFISEIKSTYIQINAIFGFLLVFRDLMWFVIRDNFLFSLSNCFHRIA